MNFPNVPNFPGVPQIPRLPGVAGVALSIGKSALSGLLWQSSQNAPQWGIFKTVVTMERRIFKNGQFVNTTDRTIQPTRRERLVQVLESDSILSFDNRNESAVMDFPVQEGSFASYNKVASPFDVTLRISRGGSQEDRQALLAELASIQKSLDLYTILTPERPYVDVNLVRYEVPRRGPAGAYFLGEVDLFFREIRTVESQFTSTSAAPNTANAQSPSAPNPQVVGSVRTSPAPITAADQIPVALARSSQ